jgi:hypothetical protein
VNWLASLSPPHDTPRERLVAAEALIMADTPRMIEQLCAERGIEAQGIWAENAAWSHKTPIQQGSA